MLIHDTNVTINVTDLDRSVTFYESLGFRMKQRFANYYAQLEAPGITIGLHPSQNGSNIGSGNVSIGFTTDDLEATKKELADAGIDSTERNEEGGQFLHFTDPDSTQLYFIKPKW